MVSEPEQTETDTDILGDIDTETSAENGSNHILNEGLDPAEGLEPAVDGVLQQAMQGGGITPEQARVLKPVLMERATEMISERQAQQEQAPESTPEAPTPVTKTEALEAQERVDRFFARRQQQEPTPEPESEPEQSQAARVVEILQSSEMTGERPEQGETGGFTYNTGSNMGIGSKYNRDTKTINIRFVGHERSDFKRFVIEDEINHAEKVAFLGDTTFKEAVCNNLKSLSENDIQNAIDEGVDQLAIEPEPEPTPEPEEVSKAQALF